MSAKSAIAILKTSPKAAAKTAAKGNDFDNRMRAQGNVKVGVGAADKAKDTNPVLATARRLGIAN